MGERECGGRQAALLVVGRGFLFHFGEELIEARIGVKGLEVAVGLGILEVEIAGVDCVAKKFEGFVAMSGESSATGEIVIGTAKTWLARLLPNASMRSE